MKKKKPLGMRIKLEIQQNWILYLMILPVLVYYIIFHYWPMYGLSMAFQDYSMRLGPKSPWVGLDNFKRFFNLYETKNLIKNTLTLSVYSLLLDFPLPIIFALLLHYLRTPKLRKCVQMVSYAPHFISTVVICGMITMFTKVDTGVFNIVLRALGFEAIDFLAKPHMFKHIYVWSAVWQNMGWSAIIYISALAGVDYEMHEAAIIDGASKVQRIRFIDIPSIVPTIVMLLILRCGSLMNVGLEKAFLLQNDLNRSASNIISVYVYNVGLVDRDYGYSAAVGLFNTMINLILVVSANQFSKKVFKESLF